MRRETAVVMASDESTAQVADPPASPLSIRLHASCVRIDDQGVVLLGPSGSGKSDLALRLIDAGAVLVADDQLLVERVGDRLVGRPAARLAGLLEVRGLGIVRLRHAEAAALRLVVELERGGDIPRLPERTRTTLLGLELAYLRLDPAAPSAPAIVRVALAAERAT